MVYKIAHSYCPSREDMEDLVQEIFLQAWKSFSSYDPEQKFSTWMYRISLNVAISHYRSKKRQGTLLSLEDYRSDLADPADGGQSDESAARLQQLHQLIAGLPALDRALMLLYLDEKTHAEMSDILGISLTNVSTKISRIRMLLRQQLSPIKK